MKKNSRFLSFFIFLILFLCFIYIIPSKGEILNKRSSHNYEAEAKYLLARNLMEQAFYDVDIYQHLISGEEAFARAIENFIVACDLNYAKACSEIGSYYANGAELLRKDKQKAIYFLEKALSLGDYSQGISLLYSYYSNGDYEKIIHLSGILLNSGCLKSVRDESSVFYCLKRLYDEKYTNFLNYTKAYACCVILSKTDGIITTTMYNHYLSKLSQSELKNVEYIINNCMTNKIWGE